MFRRWTLTTLAVTAALTAGCRGRLFHRQCDSPPPRTDRPRDRGDFPPGVIQPRETIPPSSLPTTPGSRTFDPADSGRRLETFRTPRLEDPATPYMPPATLPHSPGSLPQPLEQPQSESNKLVEPGRPKKLILVPETMPDSQSKYPTKTADGLPLPDRSVILDPTGPGAATDPQPERSAGPLPTPPFPDSPRTSNSSPKDAPAGLPGYAEVLGERDVASGRKPSSSDGFDWLQKNGFKAVLYLHPPTADTGPMKELCEKRGMRLFAVPVAPGKVKEATAAFDKVIGDTANRPLYVCDDGTGWAGALWYAHFRGVKSLHPDTAKVRAGALGLDESGEPGRAVQEYLRTK